jgi:hypothetical protein
LGGTGLNGYNPAALRITLQSLDFTTMMMPGPMLPPNFLPIPIPHVMGTATYRVDILDSVETPEPATMALMAAGVAVLAFRRRSDLAS